MSLDKELVVIFKWQKLENADGYYAPLRDGHNNTAIEFDHIKSEVDRLDTYFHELTHFIIDIENRNRKERGLRPIKIHGATEDRICREVAKAATEAYLAARKRKPKRKVKKKVKKK